ncbi:MarC family protein [Nonomuraea sp. NN258]|uniref:MarC family protein n=1 Tax=Nonomuraea antri TaxID=2730852 RepID=UPI001567E310|nr:MarC family protein [Nonomuraea antri]NRQ40058.1 MarC family protein [Nonomuraea antri]
MPDVRFFVEAFVTMFVIMDPPGVIPLFLAYTFGRDAHERKRIAWQAAVTAFGLIVVFAVFGQVILGYLHVEVPAMQIAGGLLLLLVALELLRGVAQPRTDTVRSNVNVALVPLGTPLLAGPGAIVATIVFAQQAAGRTVQVATLLVAIAAVHILLWLFMRFSAAIIRVIKENGVELVTRIAGLLLSALAVQLIINAIRSLMQTG